MQEIKGKSKNSVIYVYEGYTYHMDKRLKNTYRCSVRRTTKCCGVIKIGNDNKICMKFLHDHAPNSLILEKYILKEEMLRLSRETLRTKKDIFDDVCRRNPEAATHIAFKSVRSQLSRERAKTRPSLPDSIDTLAIQLKYYDPVMHFYKGMIIANDGKKALLFSDDKLLEALRSSTEIYCDGTFSVVPRYPQFRQLYTIHIRYMGKLIPVVFALCEARTAALYDGIWLKVKELIPGLESNIQFIMTDYECAAMTALEVHFPNANIHGCWFHFNQAVKRKWNSLGLKDSSNVILSMIMTMPLLPEEYFREAYNIICQACNEKQSDYNNVKKFLTYIETYWLTKASKVSVYKCPLRTNNAVESFHNGINRKLGKSHLNLWSFLEQLINLITDQKIDLQRLHNNEVIQFARSRKLRERDIRIFNAQTDLISGRLPLQEFLHMFVGSFNNFMYKQKYITDGCEDTLEFATTVSGHPVHLKNTSIQKSRSTLHESRTPVIKINKLSENDIAKWTKRKPLSIITNTDTKRPRQKTTNRSLTKKHKPDEHNKR